MHLQPPNSFFSSWTLVFTPFSKSVLSDAEKPPARKWLIQICKRNLIGPGQKLIDCVRDRTRAPEIARKSRLLRPCIGLCKFSPRHRCYNRRKKTQINKQTRELSQSTTNNLIYRLRSVQTLHNFKTSSENGKQRPAMHVLGGCY